MEMVKNNQMGKTINILESLFEGGIDFNRPMNIRTKRSLNGHILRLGKGRVDDADRFKSNGHQTPYVLIQTERRTWMNLYRVCLGLVHQTVCALFGQHPCRSREWTARPLCAYDLPLSPAMGKHILNHFCAPPDEELKHGNKSQLRTRARCWSLSQHGSLFLSDF